MHNKTPAVVAVRKTILAAISAKATLSNKHLAAQVEQQIAVALRTLNLGRVADAHDFAEQALGMCGVLN